MVRPRKFPREIAGDSARGGDTCLIVIAGFHPSSSLRMDRQTVPEGYTFGWNKGGSNLPRPPTSESRDTLFKGECSEARFWRRFTFRRTGRIFYFMSRYRTGWAGGFTFRKEEMKLEHSILPCGALFPWNARLPLHKI